MLPIFLFAVCRAFGGDELVSEGEAGFIWPPKQDRLNLFPFPVL